MLIVSASDICGEDVARATDTLITSHAKRIATVAADAAATHRPIMISDEGRLLRRLTAHASAAITRTKTAREMKKMTHHSHSMAAACGPAAPSIDCATFDGDITAPSAERNSTVASCRWTILASCRSSDRHVLARRL